MHNCCVSILHGNSSKLLIIWLPFYNYYTTGNLTHSIVDLFYCSFYNQFYCSDIWLQTLVSCCQNYSKASLLETMHAKSTMYMHFGYNLYSPKQHWLTKVCLGLPIWTALQCRECSPQTCGHSTLPVVVPFSSYQTSFPSLPPRQANL